MTGSEIKKQHIIILGPPGSGKGTQSKFIQECFGIQQLSTGDLLRDIMNEKSHLSASIKKTINSGGYVDDGVILELIQKHVEGNKSIGSLLFDGYPRNLAQAKGLSELLDKLSQSISLVIELKIDNELLLNRIINRFTCAKCNHVYNKTTAMPKVDGVCDYCGSCDFIFREDDDNKTFQKRLAIYSEQTKPLMIYYKKQNLLKSINAQQAIQKVSEDIHQLLSRYGFRAKVNY